MIYGYARVSSTEQNLDRQILALQKYVEPKNIVTDKQSGKNLDRPGYNALKGIFGLRPGDVLYIVSLDRLSRNKEDIKNEVAWFKARQGKADDLDLQAHGAVPENQKWIIDMIQNILIEVLSSHGRAGASDNPQKAEGRDRSSQRKGKHLGRPYLKVPDNFEEVYAEWKSGAITARAAQRNLECPVRVSIVW